MYIHRLAAWLDLARKIRWPVLKPNALRDSCIGIRGGLHDQIVSTGREIEEGEERGGHYEAG